MKMRNMIAAIAAMAVSAVCVAAVPVSAADTEIAYTPLADSEAMGTDNDGVSLRRNIFNVWGNNFKEIDGEKAAVMDKVTINFTVSGLGDRHCNKNEDGTDADEYYVFIAGAIGDNEQAWKPGDAGSESVAITGDGEYSATWDFANDSESISCLILQSNINLYQFEGASNAADCGVVFTVNSIVTTAADATEETTTVAETTTTAAGETTTAAGETTTASGTTTGSGSTTAAGSTTTKSVSTTAAAAGGNSSASASTTAAASTTNTATGETNGIVVAAVALTLAGGVALVSRKRK